LSRVDNTDLNLFEFDYDLTMMVFFLDAQEHVYARYGGRDSDSADARQSLDGLHYTMNSVLEMHGREQKEFAPKSQEKSKHLSDVTGRAMNRGCLHCHQVREALNAAERRTGKTARELAWRYPLPENLGVELEVDRGNVVKKVTAKSPAAAAGLKPGDVVRKLDRVPIHSFGDTQFALDHAPATGTAALVYERGDQTKTAKLELPDGWRRTDISWRTSAQNLVAASRLYGLDLAPEQKKALGRSADLLAFRQKDTVPDQAKAAGVRPGDVILGVNGEALAMDVNGFQSYIRQHYIVGERVTVNLIRDNKRLDLLMTFER
jgi:predicted metalloprotease with PDZ domain